jgi:hypothetical protein
MVVEHVFILDGLVFASPERQLRRLAVLREHLHRLVQELEELFHGHARAAHHSPRAPRCTSARACQLPTTTVRG